MEMKTKCCVKVTPDRVEVNGEPLATVCRGEALLTEVYRAHVNDYPKFFKMDGLSKLGFLASELLLQACGDRHTDSEDRAVILFGRYGSLAADSHYQQTIAHADDFFPSPALFVYTLPNIVTGEIALRNGYHGETAYYLLDQYDERQMQEVVEASFQDGLTRSTLCGWTDYEDDRHFEARLFLYMKE